MVREVRKEQGYEAKYVAEYLGIKHRTYNAKERRNTFTIKQLTDLKELFHLESTERLLH